MTTLDDLKRAVIAFTTTPYESNLDDLALAVEAWRTAFEWLNRITSEEDYEIGEEHAEGMRLIREHLK